MSWYKFFQFSVYYPLSVFQMHCAEVEKEHKVFIFNKKRKNKRFSNQALAQLFNSKLLARWFDVINQ